MEGLFDSVAVVEKPMLLLEGPIDVGGIDRQGAVEVDGNLGKTPLQLKFAQDVEDLLRAPHREGGDDHLPPALDRAFDDAFESGEHVLLRMKVLAVGAL